MALWGMGFGLWGAGAGAGLCHASQKQIVLRKLSDIQGKDVLATPVASMGVMETASQVRVHHLHRVVLPVMLSCQKLWLEMRCTACNKNGH